MPKSEVLDYSPTSPGDGDEPAPPASTSVFGANKDPPTRPTREDDTFDAAYGGVLAAAAARAGQQDKRRTSTEPAEAVPQPQPVLKVGSKLDQELRLKPNRWIKVGRNPKSQLLLDVAGVSRDHCALRWDPYQRRVELSDTSVRGTFVNQEITRNAIRILQHGDRVCIEGKGKRYVFVLDLRAVGLGFSDPCQLVLAGGGIGNRDGVGNVGNRKNKLAALKADMEKTEAILKDLDIQSFHKEQEYYDLIARRQLRIEQDKVNQMQLEQLEHDNSELQDKLTTSREDWLVKLKTGQDITQSQVGPVIDLAAELQVQLEKLKLKKAELERSINPHKFAFIEAGSSPRVPGSSGGLGSSSHQLASSSHQHGELSRQDSHSEPLESRSNNPSSPQASSRSKHGSESGENDEEHAFADSSGSGKPPKAGKKEAAKADAAKAKADEDSYTLGLELFGDFDSQDEEEGPGEAAKESLKPAVLPEAASGGESSRPGDDDDVPLAKKARTE